MDLARFSRSDARETSSRRPLAGAIDSADSEGRNVEIASSTQIAPELLLNESPPPSPRSGGPSRSQGPAWRPVAERRARRFFAPRAASRARAACICATPSPHFACPDPMRSASDDSPRAKLRAFTTAVIARETLKEVATLLGERGIPVMPLKGVLFQLLLYSDPTERLLCDVDVLVPEARFAEAIAILVEHGYRPGNAGPSWIEAVLESPRGLPVDLHRRIFCAWRYRMPTHEQFARATLDRDRLGAPIHLQHPLDSLAHLVGKFVSDHVHAEAAGRFAELEKLADAHALAPLAVAAHLERCGLARAARHVFSRAAREREHPFHGAVLQALPDGVLTASLVALAGTLARRFERGPFAALSAHLLNASLGRGVSSLLLALVYAAEHARLRHGRGRRGGYWAPFFSAASSSARRRASSARAV